MPRIADHRVKIDLLRAAEAVFAEQGLAAAKVEAITSRAGVSKGAFYLHFDSKEDCWRRIIESFLARLSGALDAAERSLEAEPLTPEHLLARAYAQDCESFAFCWRNRLLLRMLLGGGGGVPYAYLIDEFAEHTRRRAEGWIRKAVEAGLYRSDIDPAIVATLLSGAYDRLARELIKQDKHPDIGAWCRQALDLFAQGLFAEGRRPNPRIVDALVDQTVSRPGRIDAPPQPEGEPPGNHRRKPAARKQGQPAAHASGKHPANRRTSRARTS